MNSVVYSRQTVVFLVKHGIKRSCNCYQATKNSNKLAAFPFYVDQGVKAIMLETPNDVNGLGN
jgi:hypothetical protein